jgi:hypothetical protein
MIIARVNVVAPEHCHVWRQNTGAAMDRQGNFIKFGVPGQADITGIAWSRRIDLEVKGPKGRATPEQLAFGSMILRCGGIWCVCYCLEDALNAVELARLNAVEKARP